jgi:two-component system, OmpR family, response regulator
MRFLIVEDDEDTARYVTKGLAEHGHVVDRVVDGRSGLFQAREVAYDALLVDRMLPGLDGLSLVKVLREAGVKTPVLFLTALGGLDDRVAGLDGGGDDYLAKPFAFSELLARLNALARRPPLVERQRVLRVADLELNPEQRTVARAGVPIALQPREFRLLEYLMRHAGTVVTRGMLLEQVWDFDFDPKTSLVEAHISRLRAKIDRPFGAELIHTLRGAGYTIRAP